MNQDKTTGVFAADEMKTEEECLEQGKSLHSGVEEYHQLNWTFKTKIIATCRGNTDRTGSCEIEEEYRGKLKMDNQTGSLTFINISSDLIGLYQMQIFNKSYKTSDKIFNVTVCNQETDQTKPGQGLGAGAGLGLGLGSVGVVLLVIVGVVVYCRCRRNRNQNGVV